MNPHSKAACMSGYSLLEGGAKSEGEVTGTGVEPRTTSWLHVLVMRRTWFRMNPHSIAACMSGYSLLEGGAKSEGEVTATGVKTRTTYFLNEHSTMWLNWPNDWAVFWVLICTVHLTVCSCHVTYVFQSESTRYSCLNLKELLARSRREKWRWSDCDLSGTQNQ